MSKNVCSRDRYESGKKDRMDLVRLIALCIQIGSQKAYGDV